MLKIVALTVVVILPGCQREVVTTRGRDDAHAAPADGVSAAVSAPAALGAVTAISATGDATCALLSTGQVACWGSFGSEDCDSDIPLACVPVSTPVILPGPVRFREISLAGHGRGLSREGRVMQWGRGVYPFKGELPLGRTVRGPSVSLEAYRELSLLHPGWIASSRGGEWADLGAFDSLTPLRAGIEDVDRLRFLTCYEVSQGAVFCARPERSEDGWTTTGPIDPPSGTVAFFGYYDVACVRHSSGEIDCWRVRDDDTSALGFDPAKAMRLPLPRPVSELMVGMNACAVLDDGGVACWDGNALAEIDPTTVEHLPVDLVMGLDAVTVAEYTGLVQVCATTRAKRVTCWQPKLRALRPGVAPAISREAGGSRVQVVAAVEGVVSLAGGGEHMCALTEAGEVWCWGDNRRGECGIGRTSEGAEGPVRVVAAISTETLQ